MRTFGGMFGVAVLLAAISTLNGCSSGTPLAAGDLARWTNEPRGLFVHQPPRLPLTVFTRETTTAERLGSSSGLSRCLQTMRPI